MESTDRQAHTKVNTEDILGLRKFSFNLDIIKDRSNYVDYILYAYSKIYPKNTDS